MGSIGWGGIENIAKMYLLLRKHGFDTLDHITRKGMDYSKIKDFRDRKRLSQKIVDLDLKYVSKADVLVLISDPPSFGAAIETWIGKEARKRKVVLLAKTKVPSPWPVAFSDYIVKSERGLFRLLKRLEQEERRRKK